MVSTLILGVSVIGRGAASLGGYLETSVTRSPTEAAPHPSRTVNLHCTDETTQISYIYSCFSVRLVPK
jgi:hypothetical protein